MSKKLIFIFFLIACLTNTILFSSCLKRSQAAIQIHSKEENFITSPSMFNKTKISEPLAILASGTSGDCEWEIDYTNTLTIIGPGTLGTVKNNKESIWKNYVGQIKQINISNEVICPSNSSSLFSGLKNLKKITGLQNLKTNNVTDMSYMFLDCRSLTSLDLSSFDTTNVTNMNSMFHSCLSLKSLNLSSFDTSNVTDMSYMFFNCRGFSSLSFSNFDTSNVTNMNSMFSSCNGLKSLDLNKFNTSQVTDMSQMFAYCQTLTSLDITNFNTARVTNMSNMFSNCEKLTSLDFNKFKNFDTSQVTDMSQMFANCYLLNNLNVTKFNTSKVTDMSYMFFNCIVLTNLNITNFNTSKVMNMSQMFANCLSLSNLDLNGFNTNNVTNMKLMFDRCLKLWKITLGRDFTFVNSGNSYPNIYGIKQKFDDQGEKWITVGSPVKWQAVGTGTVHAPKGVAFISSDFPNIKERGKAETYVWQHQLFNERPELFEHLSNQSYPYDYRSNNLPNLTITGTVKDNDSSAVSLYYAIDQEPSQDDAHKFTDVAIGPNMDNEFSLNIKKQEELKTLAKPKQGGHTVQILAVDNGAQGSQTNSSSSEISTINIRENGIIDFQYLNADNQKIKAPQTLVEAVNETQDQVNNYLPKVIWRNNERYNLNQEKISQNAKDLINSDKMPPTYNEINGILKAELIYDAVGQVSLQIPQNLDFGKHVRPTVHKQFDLEQKPEKPLVVTDTTQEPNWMLCLSVTPFKVMSTGEAVNNNLLFLSYNDISLFSNIETPIATYKNFQTTSSDSGVHITNISDSWWDANSTQQSGPRLNVNSGNLPISEYSLTATWTIENSIF